MSNSRTNEKPSLQHKNPKKTLYSHVKHHFKKYRLLYRLLLFIYVVLISANYVNIGTGEAFGEEYCRNHQYHPQRPLKMLTEDTNPVTIFANGLFEITHVGNSSLQEASKKYKEADVFWFQDKRVKDEKDCLFQNTIEGYERLHLKERLYGLAKKEGLEWILPLSFYMADREQCRKFKQVSKSKRRWIIKKEGHDSLVLKKGDVKDVVSSVDCANGPKIVIQELLVNPLTLENKKIDFRLYMFVHGVTNNSGTVEPHVSFFPGFARKCFLPFSENSEEIKAHVCNLRLSLAESAKENQNLNHFYVPANLLPIILQDSIRPLESKLKTALVRLVEGANLEMKINRCQLFAVDYLVTTDQKIILLEINSHPSFHVEKDKPVSSRPDIKKMYSWVLKKVHKVARKWLASKYLSKSEATESDL